VSGLAGSRGRGDRFDVPIDEAPPNEWEIWERAVPRIEADLASLANPPIRVVVVADEDDPDSAHLLVTHPEGFEIPLFVEIPGDGQGDELFIEVFDLLLDSALFEDWREPWPRCPRHPGNGHSLRPSIVRGTASWVCPVDRTPIARVGLLSQAMR